MDAVRAGRTVTTAFGDGIITYIRDDEVGRSVAVVRFPFGVGYLDAAVVARELVSRSRRAQLSTAPRPWWVLHVVGAPITSTFLFLFVCLFVCSFVCLCVSI